MKIFCFDILLAPLLLRNASGLTQNCGNASHPQSRFADNRQAKIIGGDDTQTPFSFCPPVLWLCQKFKKATGYYL